MSDIMLHPQHVDNMMEGKKNFPRFVLQYDGEKNRQRLLNLSRIPFTMVGEGCGATIDIGAT
jgi:hypothetical protein